MNKVYIRIPNCQSGNTFKFKVFGFRFKSFYANICTIFSKKLVVGSSPRGQKRTGQCSAQGQTQGQFRGQPQTQPGQGQFQARGQPQMQGQAFFCSPNHHFFENLVKMFQKT